IKKLKKNRVDTTIENAKFKARVVKLEQKFELQLEDSDNSYRNIVNIFNPY
ncbi:25995_t:CDS:1, partial [Dentiscutata erythropus]